MSVLDDLATTIAQLATGVGPSVVGIGRHTQGSGVVVGDGRVLTNAHNLRSDTVNVTFADGRAVQGRVAAIDGDGDLAVIEVDTAGAPALTWAEGDALALGRPVFGVAAGRRRGAGHVRPRVGGRPGLPWTGWPAHRRQRRARTARAALLEQCPRRRRGTAHRPQHEPDRRGLLPGPAGGCRAAGPGRRARPGRGPDPPPARRRHRPDHVARRLRRSVGWPTGPASSSVAWMRVVWPPRPASSRATSSCRPAVDR